MSDLQKYTVDVQDAEQELKRWLVLLRQGVEIILTDEGEPLARILPIQSKHSRIPGLNRGDIEVSDDFDEPLPESFWLGE